MSRNLFEKFEKLIYEELPSDNEYSECNQKQVTEESSGPFLMKPDRK